MTGPDSRERIPVSELHFDSRDPRLAEYGVTERTNENEIISILWDTMDIQELVQSIVASGYFEQEPLIVAKEKRKFVVIEGNRRLAAVKVILDPDIAKTVGYGKKHGKSILDPLRKLPAVVSSRTQSWRYICFKHVNGPAKWNSYAKAKYIAEVHREYGISLEDIAEQIGDRHKTVQCLYRGLLILEQAEESGVFERENRYRTRFSFSHLYTSLEYEGINDFLSIESNDADSLVPPNAINRLGELCLWLYGSRRGNRPPVVETQNPDLSELDQILRKPESLQALRVGAGLAAALDHGRPPTQVLEENLSSAKLSLQHARGFLSEGFDKSDTLLRLAATIAELADDTYEEMALMNSGRRRRRETEE